MKRTTRIAVAVAVLLSVGAGTALVAQDFFRRRRNADDGLPADRNGVPNWQADAAFKTDVFTFARVRYGSWGGRRGSWGGGWRTDYPDSDLNFSFRLQQLTSLKVEPNPVIVDLTDDKLFDYPFIYMIEPGALEFTDEEVAALRRYLLNGGFMMVDDFWGDDEWENFYTQIKRVFPDREIDDLELDHEIFHCVYDLKEKPQVPSIGWARHEDPTITTDRPYDPGSRDVSYRAFYDDKGRMAMIICHNTDLGDGWEREGESEAYFREFAEKRSYPMGINIVFYAMTH
jgi:hypothetical protein